VVRKFFFLNNICVHCSVIIRNSDISARISMGHVTEKLRR